jgi:hypothetical protein
VCAWWRKRTEASARRGTEASQPRGDLLAFLDADDLWPPDKLALQVAAIEAEARPGMVFGMAQQFPSPELSDESKQKLRYVAEPAPGYLAGAMLVRREVFERAGTFSTGLHLGEFVDWYLRASDMGATSLLLPQVVLRRRLHDANQGIQKRDSRLDYVRVVRAALERRKAMAAAERS